MQANNKYDIAVVGGGLAGLCLAIQSAKKGYRVILFEKEKYPFHKVCGEYISLESWSFLERLGVPLSMWDLPIISVLETTDVAGSAATFALPLGGFGVSRYKLDHFLYKLALQHGVEVFTQTKVNEVLFENDVYTIECGTGQYLARVVAGAYGKRSNLDIKWNRDFVDARQKGLNNYIGVKYHIRYNNAANTIALHNFYNGYCGISKIENDISCLCYLTTGGNLSANNYSLAEMEKNVLSRNPHLKKIFNEAMFLYDRPLTISQVSFSNKTQAEKGVLMLGDASGLITPLCGNGMSMAMHASKIAMQSINAYLNNSLNRAQMEIDYTNKWNKVFARRLWVGRKVQQFFGGNNTTRYFLKAMKTFPYLAKNLIKATHGQPF